MQEGRRLNELQRVLPGRDTRGEKQQEQAIEPREGRAFDLSLEHNQLLAQKSIFGDQFPLPPGQITRETADKIMVGWVGPGDKAALEQTGGGPNEPVNAVYETDRHRGYALCARIGRSVHNVAGSTLFAGYLTRSSA
ncbi:MAG: hypothetical protein NVS2B16_19170 [Chloroflexota bacterium]